MISWCTRKYERVEFEVDPRRKGESGKSEVANTNEKECCKSTRQAAHGRKSSKISETSTRLPRCSTILHTTMRFLQGERA